MFRKVITFTLRTRFSSLFCVFNLLGTPIQSTLGANGVILDNQPVVKKRRGRRKNVEGVDILFFNRNKPPNHVSKGMLKNHV